MEHQVDYDCILLINDNLEEYNTYFTHECANFFLLTTNLSSLNDDILKIDKNKRSDYLLVIIEKETYNDEIKNIIKETLKAHLSFCIPHYIFVSKYDCDIFEQENFMARQNFFYKLPGPNYETESIEKSFHYFLLLIFSHIKNLTHIDDYIIQSFQTIVNTELINQQREEIERLYNELEALSKIDTLTNIYNRRALFEAMEVEKVRTLRDMWRVKSMGDKVEEFEQQYINSLTELEKFEGKIPKGSLFDHYGRLTCLLIDIDHFKQINDSYGHLTGDLVLRELGSVLNSSKIFRESDIIGRYGGEEFAIILPETNAKNALIPAERLRKHLKQIPFTYNDGVFFVTISIGIAELVLEDKKCEDLMNRADKALYHAKETGRDRTVIYADIKHLDFD